MKKRNTCPIKEVEEVGGGVITLDGKYELGKQLLDSLIFLTVPVISYSILLLLLLLSLVIFTNFIVTIFFLQYFYRNFLFWHLIQKFSR